MLPSGPHHMGLVTSLEDVPWTCPATEACDLVQQICNLLDCVAPLGAVVSDAEETPSSEEADFLLLSFLGQVEVA